MSNRNDIDGTGGDDRLRGTNGADRIRGDDGNDRINGRGGNDRLEGDDGNDTINGGDGNDRLNGDKGNDVLTGGSGADLFLFGDNDGTDRVTDFEDGLDRIRIGAPGVDGFDDLDITAGADGSAVVAFTAGGETTTITLTGVAVADLSSADFIFGPV